MKTLFAILVLIAASAFAQDAVDEQKALFAYLKVQPGKEQQFIDAAEQVINESRRESGNLIYILHQSKKDSRQFLFYELFKSDADLQYHRKAKHVIDFLATVKPILVPNQFILDEYQPISDERYSGF